MGMFFDVEEIQEGKQGRQVKGYEYKKLSSFDDPEGATFSGNGKITGTTSLGKGGVLDSVAQNYIEELDVEKEKAILESKTIITEYAAYINGEIGKYVKSFENGRNDKNRMMGVMLTDLQELVKSGIPEGKAIELCMGNYFGLDEIVKYSNDLEKEGMSDEEAMYNANNNQKLQKIVKTILKMRLNYVNRITTLMADMIKVNYKTLGLSEKQAETYIDALKSGGNESVKAAGKVKDLIRQNADKFIVNDGKSVDLRSLGFGVILGGNKRLFEDESNEEVMMRFIQHAMRYDVVVVAHGSSRDIDFEPFRYIYTTEDVAREWIKKSSLYKDSDDRDDSYREFVRIGYYFGNKINLEIENDNTTESVVNKYYDIVQENLRSGNDNKVSSLLKDMIYEYSDLIKNKFKKKCISKFITNSKQKTSDEKFKTLYGCSYDELYTHNIIDLFIMEKVIKSCGDTIIDSLKQKISKNQSKHWSCQPTRTLKAGPFTDVDELVRQLIKEGYKKILIEDCNPGHHKLAEDIMKTKGILINHSDFSNYAESSLLDSNDPSMLSINEIEQQIRSFAESYGIDYDDNEYLEECCNEYLDELYYVNESFSNNPLGEFFKKCLGAIIGFIKKIFNFFKLLMEKVKDLFYGAKAEKDIKVSIPEIKCPLIDIKEKKTVEITGKTREELKEKADKINEPISQEIKKINDNQKRDTNRIQQDIQRLERAANSNKTTANNTPTHKTESAFLEFEAGDGNDDQTQDDEENTSFTMDDGEKQNQTDDVPNTTTMVDNTKPTNTGSESNYGDSEDDTQTDDTEYSMNGAEGDGEGNDESETGDEEYTVPDDNNGGDEEVPANLEDDGNIEETPDDGSTYSMSDGVDGSDSNSDDNTDTESGDGDDSEEGSDTESELSKLENDLFERLNDKQKEIKIKNLKENYAELHKRIEQLYDIIDKANPAEEAVISVFENTKSYLLDLSKIVFNYIDNTFDTKTYMENSLQYQKFLVALNQINGILDEFVDKKKK